MADKEIHGLALLRKPFEERHISKLPKPTKQQTEAVRADFKNGMRCTVCGSWHHPDVIHLDYVGHAALTDRLLDADPHWNWEPMGFNPDGTPAFDRTGGLWIKLTVCGITRPGYGSADGKSGGDAVKEIIGDALRNAAMRFGAALDLWHKGDLHSDDTSDPAVGRPEGTAQGQSHGGEVSPDGPAPRTNWGGRYPNRTKLREARVVHHAELERIGAQGVFDDLDAYLTSPEYQDYIKIAGEQFPTWLEGELPPDAPPEYVQTFRLEQKARDMIALRGNVAIDPQGQP